MRDIVCSMSEDGRKSASLRLTDYEVDGLPLLRAWPEEPLVGGGGKLLLSACSWASGAGRNVFVVVGRGDVYLWRDLHSMGFRSVVTKVAFEVMQYGEEDVARWRLVDLIEDLERSDKLWE